MNWLFDLKSTLRLMLRNPGFALLTIAIMTIGLGICMYVYSFIHGLMLKDLPFENGDRMYVVNIVQNGIEYNGGSVAIPDYLVIKDELMGYETLGAYYNDTVNISANERVLRYSSIFTEASVFDFTKVPAYKGRVLNNEDNVPGANPVAVISYQLWQGHFAGREDILAQTMLIDGKSHRIVGVMPNGYKFPTSTDLWLPLQVDMTTINRKESYGMELYLLLREGYSINALNSQLATIMQRLAEEYPDTNSGASALAKTYRMSFVGNGGHLIMAVLLSAVLFILVLACINVGNLLLARANERSKETAIRVALGAPRWRLISQMISESLVICSLSGVFALLLAGWGLEISEQIMAKIINGPLPYFWHMKLDSHIIAISLAMVVFTALVTGLIPALKMSGGDFNAVLRDGTRGAQSKKAGKVSNALVVMEIALSCCLLTVAAVLAITSSIITSVDYGVDYDNRLLARYELPTDKYPEKAQQANFHRDFVNTLKEQPQIADASVGGRVPGLYTGYTAIKIEGQDSANQNELPRANATNFMPGMMQTLDVSPLAGRLIDDADNASTSRVAMVTDSFAMQHFGGLDAAIDKRFKFAEDEAETWYRIVGVVPHIIFGQPFSGMKDRPAVFTSSLQDTSRFMTVVMKPAAGISADSLRPAMENAMRIMDPTLPMYDVNVYEELIQNSVGGMRFISDLFKLMAIAAVALAASGIYGVMSNAIEQRTNEFGIRRALGATDDQVMRMLMKQGSIRLLIGAAIGAPLAYLMGSNMVNIFGASSIWIDLMYVAMPLLIGVIVLYATFIPARKAVRYEPSVALRYE